MRSAVASWVLLLAALLGGCGSKGTASEPPHSGEEVRAASNAAVSEPALSGKDIRLYVALAKQDRDGLPHAFRITFENASDHRGMLTLPAAMPGRPEEDSWINVPPIVGIVVTAADGRENGLVYTDIRASKPGRAEQVVLAPGQRAERVYSTGDLYIWMDGPVDGGRFSKCIKPGKDEVQVRAWVLMEFAGTMEEVEAKGAKLLSEPVVMRCSLDKRLFREPERSTPLIDAVRKGDVAAVQRLLAEGADVDAVLDEDKWTPLHRAVLANNVEIARVLLDKGANVNARDSDGETPLHWAAPKGHADLVQLLITGGADVGVQDKGGETALHRAAENGAVEAASILLASGADPNCRNRGGWTPLHLAVDGHHKDVAALLLEKGADVNAGGIGDTPLHTAALYGDAEMVELLLSKNADVTARDQQGETPLQIAITFGHNARVIELLKKHGGTE